MSDSPTPSVIWLTDRSRYDTGLDKCQRERLLSYHFGPTGYGIARQAQSMPLATGSYVHAGLAKVLAFVRDHDHLPPDDIVREAAQSAVAAYKAVIDARGMANLDAGERVDLIVTEQSYLIEGLIWAFTLTTLPWIFDQCRILEVEREELLLCGCTCGLGDGIGDLADHEQRGCDGIGFQSRPDFLTEYRQRPGVLAYWEFKTVGATSERWETQWETMVQFSAGALGAQARLGQPIQEAWVVGLIKGKREGDTYNPDTKRREGNMRQQSVLCYGWRKPGNPPLEPEDWQVTYDYRGEDGKNHRLGKAYEKVGIWHLTESVALPEGFSVPEFWTKWMEPETLGAQVRLIGPLNISPVLTHDLVEELVAEEQRWKGVVWELHGVLAEVGYDWTRPEYQAALRRLVPRSWACRRYGKRYECQMVQICFYHEGWQDPLAHGYILRRPHHTPELDQMRSRGLTPPEGWAEDQEEVD